MKVVDGMRGGKWVNRREDYTERTQTTWKSTRKTSTEQRASGRLVHPTTTSQSHQYAGAVTANRLQGGVRWWLTCMLK